jgi:hypothetical protein
MGKCSWKLERTMFNVHHFELMVVMEELVGSMLAIFWVRVLAMQLCNVHLFFTSFHLASKAFIQGLNFFATNHISNINIFVLFRQVAISH